MAINRIENGESGSSARQKINSAIDGVNSAPVSFDPAGSAAAAQAFARQRANHTGTQSIETVSGLVDALDERVVSGTVGDESVTTSTGTQTVAGAINERTVYVQENSELPEVPKSSFSASVKGAGDWFYDSEQGTYRPERPPYGPSMVERLLNCTTVKGLYVIPRSGGVGVGVNWEGEFSPASEYKFAQDADGWWRLYGASTGFSSLSTGYEPLGTEPVFEGTLQLSSTYTAYTANVGDKFSAVFQGGSIVFRSFTDDRGGVWRFRLEGGNPVDISTYSSSGSMGEQLVFEGLDPTRLYKVEAEFVGDDPENPPSGGASRGWIYWSNNDGEYPDNRRALGIIASDQVRPLDTNNSSYPERYVISPNGINEFAFKVQGVGSTEPDSWVPYHGGSTITEALESTIEINGRVANVGSIDSFRKISSFRITQRFIFRQAGQTEGLGYLTSVHCIDESGALTFDYTILPIVDFQINTWYSYQFMTDRTECPRLVMNDDSNIALASLGDSENITLPNLNVSSVAFTGASSAGRGYYHGSAIDVNMRSAYVNNKLVDSASSPLLMTTRSNGDVAKLYWRASNGYLMRVGDRYQASSRWVAVNGIKLPNTLESNTQGSIF